MLGIDVRLIKILFHRSGFESGLYFYIIYTKERLFLLFESYRRSYVTTIYIIWTKVK